MNNTKHVSDQTFLGILSDIEAAENTAEVGEALTPSVLQSEEPISKSFVRSQNDNKVKFIGRIVLLVATVILIITAGCLSIKGSAFVASWGPAISVICMILDCAVAFLLFKKVVKGPFKVICLSIEVVSLFYFGYTITVLFNADKAPVVARNYLSADYNTVQQDNYEPMISIVDLLNKAKETAGQVAALENEHGGHGVVFAKATLIQSIKPGKNPKALPAQAPDAPAFETIEDANQWLQTEETKVMQAAEAYNAYYNAIRDHARAADSSIVKEMHENTKLSQFQTGSLRSLQTLMENISSKPNADSVRVSIKSIEVDDLKGNKLDKTKHADWMAYAAGYGAEIIPIFFLFLLAYLPDTTETLEKMKNREARTLINTQLKNKGINFSPAELKAVDLEDLIGFTRQVFRSQELLSYLLDRKATFDDLLEYSKEHPAVLYYIGQGNCEWHLTTIKRRLQKDPAFEHNGLEQAIKEKSGAFQNV